MFLWKNICYFLLYFVFIQAEKAKLADARLTVVARLNATGVLDPIAALQAVVDHGIVRKALGF